MRYAAAFVLLYAILARPAGADPLCLAVFVTMTGATRPVSPECGEVPVATECREREVVVEGTGVAVRLVVCLPV